MIELLEILQTSQEFLWSMFVIFIRIGAMMATLPAFGEQTIPVRVRLSITLAFCFIVGPSMTIALAQMPQTFMQAGAFVAPEVITGLFFGLLLRFFIFSLQIAGSIAAQSTSLSQIFGGSAGTDPQPAMGHILVIAGLALAASMGLHVSFATYMINSYQLVPAGALLSSGIVAEVGLAAVSRTFALGFTLAGPFMIGSLIYNVTLGIINKAMPQLMVSFVGAPAITAGGLLMLYLAAPIMLEIWISSFGSFILTMDGDIG